jgi:hypothetical protein
MTAVKRLGLTCAALGILAVGTACPSNNNCESSDGGGGVTTGGAGSVLLSEVGGPIQGPSDNHCWLSGPQNGPLTFQSQPVNVSSCSVVDGGADFNEDAGPPGPPYGSIEWNSAGNDDDCKYFVSWTSTPIAKGVPVTFWVTAQYSPTGVPLTGLSNGDGGSAPVASCQGTLPPELYFEIGGAPDGGIANHVNPATAAGNYETFEVAPGTGVYQIGPAIFFDESGLWYIRYHFNENCCDILPDSPHGHTAFYVKVP